MSDTKSEHANHWRHYPDLQLEQIPRCSHDDPLVDELISQHKPVVVTETGLVGSAVQKWDLDYLTRTIGNSEFMVFLSKSEKFKYYDDKKATKTNAKGRLFNPDFVPPIARVDMTMGQFKERLENWKAGDERLYLQHALSNTIGHDVMCDFVQFNWPFCINKQKRHGWGSHTSNLLLIGMAGNVTPCHYDEQHNLFAQVRGHKRCLLFAPEMFECLYPHPVHHPHDRQSMVDFEQPDYERYPKFRRAHGHEAVLGPGDVLYIPIYWWHHIESRMDAGTTITINFWYRGSPNNGSSNNNNNNGANVNKVVTYPLRPHQKISVMRNIEKILLECLQDPAEMGPLLKTLVEGRFDD